MFMPVVTQFTPIYNLNACMTALVPFYAYIIRTIVTRDMNYPKIWIGWQWTLDVLAIATKSIKIWEQLTNSHSINVYLTRTSQNLCTGSYMFCSWDSLYVYTMSLTRLNNDTVIEPPKILFISHYKLLRVLCR